MTFFPIRRRKFRHKHTHREESYVNGGRGWSDAPATQGTLKISGNHQQLGRDKEGPSPRVFRERARAADILNSSFWSPEHGSVVGSHAVCGNLS